MSVEFASGVAVKKASYTCFPEDIIVTPELNGRHDTPDIQWLINDILQRGQIVPVTIRKNGDRPQLVAGFSRWRAVSEINRLELAPVKIRLLCSYTKLTEGEAFLANISENRFRNEVKPIDDAHNIKRLLNVYQFTEYQVAAFYFPTAKTDKELKEAAKFVRERVALIGLTPEAADAVRSGRVKDNAATAIAKLSEAQQREVLASKEGEITRKDLTPAKPKVVKYLNDPELIRRATQVVNDCRGGLDSATEEYLDVTRLKLAELDDYLKGSR